MATLHQDPCKKNETKRYVLLLCATTAVNICRIIPTINFRQILIMRRGDQRFKCVGNKYCCSQHFVPNDYRISLIGHRKDLKTGAMPSIFLRSSAKSHVKEERPGLLTQAKILHKEGNCQKNRHWAMKCKILLILYRSSSDRIICWSEMFRSRNPKEEL